MTLSIWYNLRSARLGDGNGRDATLPHNLQVAQGEPAILFSAPVAVWKMNGHSHHFEAVLVNGAAPGIGHVYDWERRR